MATKINAPTLIKAEGKKLKIIEEFIGHVNSGSPEISIAKMQSPQRWEEPGQCPRFNEYTVVLKGNLRVETKTEEFVVSQGQAIITYKDEWIRYSSPFEGGAEYIAVCLPAFSPDTVNRDPVTE